MFQLTRADAVGEATMAGAIGQAFDRRIAAEAEIVGAGRRDWPAASFVAQFEQRAAVAVMDRLAVLGGQRRGLQGPQQLKPRSRNGWLAWSFGGALSDQGLIAGLVARHIETGELADHGVAADPDLGSDPAAGQPGRRMDFE